MGRVGLPPSPSPSHLFPGEKIPLLSPFLIFFLHESCPFLVCDRNHRCMFAQMFSMFPAPNPLNKGLGQNRLRQDTTLPCCAFLDGTSVDESRAPYLGLTTAIFAPTCAYARVSPSLSSHFTLRPDVLLTHTHTHTPLPLLYASSNTPSSAEESMCDQNRSGVFTPSFPLLPNTSSPPHFNVSKLQALQTSPSPPPPPHPTPKTTALSTPRVPSHTGLSTNIRS